jgi:transcriptional regulator with XRE-family HTH domain
MKKTGPGRPQTSVNTGTSYALAEWLNENLAKLSGMTNAEIAAELGYERSNIVAMWKTGKTRVALHALKGIARLTNTPLEQLFPLWVEQYAREKGVKTQPYTEMLSRIVTPAEFKVIETIRNAGYTCASLTSVEYDIIQFMMMSPDQRASLFEG